MRPARRSSRRSWAAGRRARIRDGKFEDLGRNVPDQRDRVKRLVNARLRLLVQEQLGDLPSAKAALSSVMSILDRLEEDDGPVEPDEPRRATQSKKKLA